MGKCKAKWDDHYHNIYTINRLRKKFDKKITKERKLKNDFNSTTSI